MQSRTRLRRVFSLASLLLFIGSPPLLLADELEQVTTVDRQPLVSAVRRLEEAMQIAGAPLAPVLLQQLREIDAIESDVEAVRRVQSLLDPLCLASISINPESRVRVLEGPAKRELVQQGWRVFLVKVINEAGVTPQLQVDSPNALPSYERGRGTRQEPLRTDGLVTAAQVRDRFLDLDILRREPLRPNLSGLRLEYRILSLFSRDAGKREATLVFDIGAGTQDLGFRSQLPLLFDCRPAVKVRLGVRDFDGRPVTAGFVIRDSLGRVYPLPSRRLAPDFFFHNQIYREDGEHVLLPPGDYTFLVNRGPEYVPQSISVSVPDAEEHEVRVELKRWIHIAAQGWYSGDHHVHAAGCAHYDSPTEGVGPEDMMRHILGEDLNVGCVLSWGPCWYTQKEFFDGAVSKLSRPDYLMRYDVEVSGFPSSHAGHLCLLRLQEDDYPGTTRIEEWPSWTLPVLQWGKEQGGVVGYSHSGWGIALPDVMPDGSRQFPQRPWGGAPNGWQGRAAATLPDYAMPRFDGIGANEYIVTGPLGVCDFISAVDTPAIWELNIWYHTLNCGVTTRISGETDFPCIYGDRVGLGRIYVKQPEGTELTFDTWVAGLKDGRSYCGDGLSHILDFRVNEREVGQHTETGISRLELPRASAVTVRFRAAAMLEEEQTELTRSIRDRRLDDKPYWHLERSRIGDTRTVPVEVIVNGEVVSRQTLLADGHLEDFEIPVELQHSSWVAVRILPSVHTNPVFVHIDDQPIRASSRSAEWCLEAVDVCWRSKQGQIREGEREQAAGAYDEAREYYRRVLAESRAAEQK